MNFIREDNKGFGEIKKIQLYPIVENGLNEDDKLEKDFYLFWIIEEWKEILFAFVSPSLMGTGNKDSIWELMQYIKMFIKGNEAGFFYKEPFSINIFSNSERFPKYDAFWRLDEIIYDKNTQKEVVKTIWEKK